MDLPFCCDYAKSNRSVCRGCQQKVAKDTLRLAIMLQSNTFDSKVPNWYHSACFFLEHMPRDVSDISNYRNLRWDDKKQIKDIIDKGESPYDEESVKRSVASTESKANSINFSIGYSKTGNCACVACNEKIKKNEISIVDGTKKSKLLRYHFNCFSKNRERIGYLESITDLSGYAELTEDDKEFLKDELPNINEPVVAPKKQRMSDETLTPEEETLKEDTNQMHEYREELQQLTKDQLESLLKHNKQDVYRLGYDALLDKTSEMLTYGALSKCPKCNRGKLVYHPGGYHCSGKYSTYSNCNANVKNPIRTPVQVPEELKISFNFLMTYEYVPRQRDKHEEKKKNKNLPLNYLNFNVTGFDNRELAEITNEIVALGGRVVGHIKRSVFAVVTTKEELEKRSPDVLKAKGCRIYMVTRDYLESVRTCTHVEESKEIIKKFDISPWGADFHCRVSVEFQKDPSRFSNRRPEDEEEGKRKVVVKSGLAIEPDTGLSDIAHVYQENNDRFTAVLSKTDVIANRNSYYKIQLLESDNKLQYWLYRSWGRIGTDVGSFKLTQTPDLHTAKGRFYELFEEKTGNSWRNRRRMVEKRGKFIYIETDYEADINEISLSNEDKNLENHVAGSKLHPAVAHLIAMVFNVHSMKQLLLEYSLDMQKMPLGKLSKYQIKQAYNVLNDLITLLPHKSNNKRHIIECTNRFYSLMPYNSALRSPPLLDNMDLIKQKLEMLESLYEVETAYCIIQRNASDGGNVLDSYYNQLCTDMEVLDASDGEYRILQQYVVNTHGPTHEAEVQIREIFKVNRRDENERFVKYSQLDNRRLLWHGSRTTNFAGILSQGLRIAPAEAPMSGYMFGKGIYFADMVTKSANYCFVTRQSQSREGLLLLCEVALGNMCEKTKAFDGKKMKGNYQSVKGVGRTYPDGEVALSDGVIVPIGKPVVDESVRTDLIYNEYIVYDEAQVKVRYLLKVNFKFKN